MRGTFDGGGSSVAEAGGEKKPFDDDTAKVFVPTDAFSERKEGNLTAKLPDKKRMEKNRPFASPPTAD